MWDSKLILPKAPWPIKSASYTVNLTLQLLGNVSSTVVNYCFNVGVFHLLLMYIVKHIPIFKACISLLFLKMWIFKKTVDYLEFWIFLLQR